VIPRGKSPRSRGFTLIELIVTLVIVGIAAYALLKMFADTLPRSPTPSQVTQAAQLAQERMELILGQRLASGYNAAQLDPCKVGAPTICANTLGFNVTSAGTGTALSIPADPPVAWNGNPTANYKLVTVTVKRGGSTLAIENAVLASY